MAIKFDMSDLIRGAKEVDKMMADKVLDVTKKVTLDVHANVVRGSPVDTGEFRGKWTVETPSAPFDGGRIENTSPYGVKLANGGSEQAPDKWIDNAIEAATRLKGK